MDERSNNYPAQKPCPGPPPPPPLTCAILLAGCVREERGRQGVEEYVKAMAGLLPEDMVRQLAVRLNVTLPPPCPPPPPPPCPPPPPKRKDMDMGQLMKLLQVLGK